MKFKIPKMFRGVRPECPYCHKQFVGVKVFVAHVRSEHLTEISMENAKAKLESDLERFRGRKRESG